MFILYRLGHPRPLRPDFEEKFGLDKTILSRIINAMLAYIYDRTKHLLTLNIPRLNATMNELTSAISTGLDLTEPERCYCFGFIDGTFRFIARPIRNQKVYHTTNDLSILILLIAIITFYYYYH